MAALKAARVDALTWLPSLGSVALGQTCNKTAASRSREEARFRGAEWDNFTSTPPGALVAEWILISDCTIRAIASERLPGKMQNVLLLEPK